jgi:two-component system NtrC family sensor kinase
MNNRWRNIFKPPFLDFDKEKNEQLSPYYTFTDYRQIWAIGIFLLAATALLPLIVVTVIHYQLIEASVDSEFILRTESLTSNARRAVTFFLEERLDALRFTVNEIGYDELSIPGRLDDVLKNLKLGFGGLTDLSIISHTGNQEAYAGPYHLEGKNYSQQAWYIESQKKDSYVSPIFKGYRDVPHFIIAEKSHRPDGTFFTLRATLETEKLMQTLTSYQTGKHVDIFLVDRSGVIQTPSKFCGSIFQKLPQPIPEYSPRTQVVLGTDRQARPIIMGYAFIATQTADTPFILIVVKQKAGMMGVWQELRTNINEFVGFGIITVILVVTIGCTFIVNRLFMADKAKAEAMALMEESSQLATIGQIAAGVAHEINNPLALINETAGYVKDLFVIKQQYRQDDELLENIDSILEAVERCGTITSQLLGFSRKFAIRNQKVDIRDTIADVLVFHRKESEYRNVKISVDIPDAIPQIETDRGRLQQILMNLVNNAFQAVDDGCCVDIRAVYDGFANVSITISDNGCGIAEAHLPQIFEPFFTTKKEGKGTGLGLPITYGLVKKLHGDISVNSKENEGTTFIVTLPVRVQEDGHEDKSTVGG